MIIRYNTPGIIEASGLYSNSITINGEDSWACASNGCYIYYTNSEWVIFTNTSLNTNRAFLWKTGEPVGTYAASNFITGVSTAWYDYVWTNGVDPEGTYDFAGETNGYYFWTKDVWFVAYNTNESAYFISSNSTIDKWAPSWKSDFGTEETGKYSTTYSTAGMVAAGTATVAYLETGLPNYLLMTNIVYEVNLYKLGAQHSPYMSTNIEHSMLGLYYKVEAKGTFDPQSNAITPTLIEGIWNGTEGAGSYGNGTHEYIWLGGDLSILPEEAAEPTNHTPPAINYRGFAITEPIKSVVDWKFQYSTNKWW